MTGRAAPQATIRLSDILEEFDERLGARPEPEVLTLTEKRGFVAQRERFSKRLAVKDTSNYKVIGLYDVAFNPYLLWAAAVAQNTEWEDAIISPLYPTFHIREGYDPRFVNYILHSDGLRARYDSISFGSVPRRRRATVASFLDLRVQAPPEVFEQRRIADMLDRAEALRAKRRAALAHLNALAELLFLDLIDEPLANAKRFALHRLGDVTEFYAGSTLPAGRPFNGQEAGHLLLKVSDLNRPGNEVTIDSAKLWSDSPGAKSCTCPADSVVFPKRGGAIATNRKRLTTRSCVLDPNLIAVTPDRSVLRIEYLFAWVQRLDLKTLTSGSSVPQLNKRDLAPLKIPIPDLTLQGIFAGRVAIIEKLKALHRSSLAKLDELFASLQYRAFRGEL